MGFARRGGQLATDLRRGPVGTMHFAGVRRRRRRVCLEQFVVAVSGWGGCGL